MSRNVCCVPECPFVAGDGVPLHYFPCPEKDAKRFQEWVKFIGGDIASLDSITIHKNKRICRQHFQKDVLYPKNRLSKLAVPSLVLTSVDVSGDNSDHNYCKKKDFEKMAEDNLVIAQDFTTSSVLESSEMPLTSECEESIHDIQIDLLQKTLEIQGIDPEQNLLFDYFESDHLQPKPSFMAERYRFRQRKQNADEPILQYISELESMSKFCDFNTVLEENLRDQLVCGLRSEQIRQRLFAEELLDYSKAVKIACAMEAAETVAGVVEQTLESNGVSGDGEVATRVLRDDSAGGRISATDSKNNCSVCGSADHWGEGCGQSRFTCGICLQKGHLNWDCQMHPGGRQRQQGRRCDTANMGSRQLPVRCDTDDKGAHVPAASGATGQLDLVDQLGEDKPSSSDKENWEAEENLQQCSWKGYKRVVLWVDEAQLPMDIDMESIVSCVTLGKLEKR